MLKTHRDLRTGSRVTLVSQDGVSSLIDTGSKQYSTHQANLAPLVEYYPYHAGVFLTRYNEPHKETGALRDGAIIMQMNADAPLMAGHTILLTELPCIYASGNHGQMSAHIMMKPEGGWADKP